ncbi:BPTI/Kunitz domain-containing protein-like, partial [Notechis scutatus]|uniref:BPTI/Kunitz domain-containing protein-like n=1 Tax=Notechis scutatus TaxID=8663 RepID=A0A6J1VQM4_9SAUR
TPDCSSFPTYFERCRLPKEHFFYNKTAKRCQLFLDFGCPGSLNTYDTLRKCQQSCSEIDICTLPPDRGPCKEKLHRWFYEPKTSKCTKFTFGGCEGNANNFNVGPPYLAVGQRLYLYDSGVAFMQCL